MPVLLCVCIFVWEEKETETYAVRSRTTHVSVCVCSCVCVDDQSTWMCERKRVTCMHFLFCVCVFVCEKERESMSDQSTCVWRLLQRHLSLEQHHWEIVSTVDQDKTSRPEGLNAAAQQKSIQKYQSISVCRIRRRGKKEGDGTDALGNRKKEGKNRSGEEDEWVWIQQLPSKGVETKPGFAVFFILGM